MMPLDTNTLRTIDEFYETLIRVGGETLRFDRVFAAIGEALKRTFSAEQVSIWVVDPHQPDPVAPGARGIVNAAFSTLPDDAAARMPTAAPLTGSDVGRAFAEGRPVARSAFDFAQQHTFDVENARGAAQLWMIPFRPLVLRLDTPEVNPHNVLAVATIGVADDAAAGAITPDVAQFFCRVCGKALERALWAEQELVTQKVYEALDHVDLDRHGAMESVARAIAESMRFEACTILQAEEARRVLHVLGTTGIESNVPLRKMQYPYGYSCSGWVADHRESLATEDFRTCEQRQGPLYTDKVLDPTRFQYLGAPLLSNNGELLGVVRLRNKIPPAGFRWPSCLTYLDRKRAERVARIIAPLISLMIKERERTATMERIRHDIDMPATAIRDSAGILVREPDAAFHNDMERVRQRLEDMESFAEILLVNSELMGMSRTSDVPFRPENVLPLAGFVAKLCKMLSPAARRRGLSGILYNQGSFFSIPSLWLDPRLFQIAMYNLLQNAIKYSNPGTVVTVEGESVRASDAETWYCIHVKNTGIGVTDEEAPLIFDRAYRSRRARKRSETGLGIGLTTAKELIERHGGRLVLTRQNNPTVFTIQLPGYLANRRPE